MTVRSAAAEPSILHACVASLALLLVAGPEAMQAHADAGAATAGPEAGASEYALEFGEPDPDPEHPDPEGQRVLEDPAGWPWWAWVAVLVALIVVGVPVAVLLMRKVRRVRSESDREGNDRHDADLRRPAGRRVG